MVNGKKFEGGGLVKGYLFSLGAMSVGFVLSDCVANQFIMNKSYFKKSVF